jgi:SAM-dependent methyltransferase
MLAQARAKFAASGVHSDLHLGDMTAFDLDDRFGLVFVASNSLTHVHAADDITNCFRAVRRHLTAGGRFAFDVFNPSVQILAGADGLRREKQRFMDPERGEIRVDVEERYDAAAQVMRGTWYFSTESDPDFLVTSVDVRSMFPQELGLLLAAGGLHWSNASATSSAHPSLVRRRLRCASARLRRRCRLTGAVRCASR